MSILQREFGLAPHLSGWMDYYAYHLEHPELCQRQVALAFGTSKSVINRAYLFMNEHITDCPAI